MPETALTRRRLLLGGTAMIGFSLGSSLSLAQSGPSIVAPALMVDDNAPPATVLAPFSIVNDVPGSVWTLSLTDDAGGMFSLSANTLVVGSTPLSHMETPTPEVALSATDGSRTITATFKIRVQRPLSVLPLATGAKVMGIGHSFVGNSGYTVIYPESPPSRIDTMTANWLGTIGPLRNVDNRFNADAWYDPTVPTGVLATARMAGAIAGLGGEHMPQTLARLPWCIARAPDIILLDIGTNDIASGGISLEQAIWRYEALLAPIRDAGIRVICLLPIDRIGTGMGLWPEGDPRHAISNGLAEYLVSINGRPGVTVIDDRALLADALSQNKPVTEDGVHLNTFGQWLRYSLMMPQLRALVQDGDFYSRDHTLDNLSPLGGLIGSGGTKSGITGSVATGMTATRAAGQSDTIVASKETIAGGIAEKQVFTVTPASNANASRVCTLSLTWPNMTFASMGLSADDWVEAGFDYELSASNDWLGLDFALEGNSTGNIARYVATGGMVVRLNTSQEGPHLSEPLIGRATIPRFRLLGSDDVAAPADFFRTSLRPIRLHWKKTSTDILVAKISPIIIRKSTDPRPTWNL